MKNDRLLELAGLLNEAKEYEDSAQFTEDYTTVLSMIDKIGKIINTKKWENWMKVTEQNYGVKTIDVSNNLKSEWKKLKKQSILLESQFNKADDQ
jgi:hypothetical protein